MYHRSKKQIRKAVEEAFKDYKDPTIGMSITAKKEFDKVMRAEIKKRSKQS